MQEGLRYFLVFLIGIVVGTAELLSRYRDSLSFKIEKPAAIYLFLNGISPIIALYLESVFDFPAFAEPATAANSTAVVVNRILLAGFGSLAFLRSSFFTLRIGGQDVAVGPASILQALFDSADRAVDRESALSRSTEIAKIMTNISFKKAQAVLPTLCQTLLQNLSSDDQVQLNKQITALAGTPDTSISDTAKATILGLMLMNQVGQDVLGAAVNALRSQITVDGVANPVEKSPTNPAL